MPCKLCLKKPVIKLTNNNIKLCKICFNRYFEKKILKTIRKYDLLDNCRRIGVAVSGGKNSLIVLSVLNKIIKQRISKNIQLIAVYIDEKMKNYSENNKKLLKKFCAKNKIKLYIYPIKIKKDISSALIKNILNKKARRLKIERIATGHNMDLEAETIIMNQLRNDMTRSSRLGVIVDANDKRFVPRIKPLYFITENESLIYAKLNNIKDVKNPFSDSLRDKVRIMLNSMESRYPGTKNNIINSFLEILPNLKNKYNKKIKNCKICNEPCSQDICNSCSLLKTRQP